MVPPRRGLPGRKEGGPGFREAAEPSDDPATWDADRAVTVLYTAHWGALVRLAALLTGDASVAEEVVQEAFVALHRRWPRLSDPGAAAGYLRTSVVNGARSVVRHRGVQERHRPAGAAPPAGPEERAPDGRARTPPCSLPSGAAQTPAARCSCSATTPTLSEQEIATTLGISRGAVKSHAHRGLAALRAALAGTPEVTP